MTSRADNHPPRPEKTPRRFLGEAFSFVKNLKIDISHLGCIILTSSLERVYANRISYSRLSSDRGSPYIT